MISSVTQRSPKYGGYVNQYFVVHVQQRRISSETSSSNQAIFGRVSSDRQLSLSERKKALIESARRRYIEKHGLTPSS